METINENTQFSLVQTISSYTLVNELTGFYLTNKKLTFDHANQLFKSLAFLDINITSDINIDTKIDKCIQLMRKNKKANEVQLFNICCDILEKS